jgi:hypothetical protein
MQRRRKIMSEEAALDTGGKNRKPSLIAYQVRDKDGDSYWDRVGIAWSNRDAASPSSCTASRSTVGLSSPSPRATAKPGSTGRPPQGRPQPKGIMP